MSRPKRPPQPPADGYCWARIKGGPRNGEWVQVLLPQYQERTK